jgi:hypothetical protein
MSGLRLRVWNFRATKDIDIVLIVEALDQAFIARFWEFVEAGQYEIRERYTGSRELYRFSKPKDDTYPAMLELFSRQPGRLDLSHEQRVIPVEIDENSASLSAILLDEDYYALISRTPPRRGRITICHSRSLDSAQGSRLDRFDGTPKER